MAHDFGIGGSFFGRVDRVSGPAHRGARVYQVRDSPMMPAVTNEPKKPQKQQYAREDAQPRHLPAAQSVHHRLPVLGFLFHRGGDRRQLRRAGGAVFIAMLFDGLDGRVARWTRHRKPVRQGIRQPRRHGRLRRRTRGPGLSVGRGTHQRIRPRMAALRLGHRVLLCAVRGAAPRALQPAFGQQRQALLPGSAQSLCRRRGGRVHVVLRQVA